MTKLKSAVVFTVIVCMTGSFHKAVNAQMNLGGYCYSCAYNPMYPHLDKPSSSENNSQTTLDRSRVSSPRSASRLTRLQIRDIAYNPTWRKKMQNNLCGTYIRPRVNGYRLSSSETAVLREELGCFQSNRSSNSTFLGNESDRDAFGKALNSNPQILDNLSKNAERYLRSK
jgi:hypothetical protein